MRAPISIKEALPKGTSLLGGTYVVERPLGQGGFGITYLCHTNLGRPVAIKEFSPQGFSRQGRSVQPPADFTVDGFEAAKQKFTNEARTLSTFKHPSIVDVHSFFEENSTAYMVMEYLAGKTLVELVEERGAGLPQDEAMSLTGKVGAALNMMHAKRCLHRDVNPGNVMVCNDGRVVLMDFGLARELEQAGYNTRRLTGTTSLGTHGYAPPEQYSRTAQMTAATDVYALGATLFYLLTGDAPPSAVERSAGEDLPDVRTLNTTVSPAFNKALHKALEMKVADRPQSVREFWDLLKLVRPGITPPPLATPSTSARLAPLPPTPQVPHAPLPPTPQPLTPTTPSAAEMNARLGRILAPWLIFGVLAGIFGLSFHALCVFWVYGLAITIGARYGISQTARYGMWHSKQPITQEWFVGQNLLGATSILVTICIASVTTEMMHANPDLITWLSIPICGVLFGYLIFRL